MKDSGEFFKNLLDDQTACDQQKRQHCLKACLGSVIY